jgi:hypothetical protein
VDENGTLVLADEVLTPDSSRFWPKDLYEKGKSQPRYLISFTVLISNSCVIISCPLILTRKLGSRCQMKLSRKQWRNIAMFVRFLREIKHSYSISCTCNACHHGAGCSHQLGLLKLISCPLASVLFRAAHLPK